MADSIDAALVRVPFEALKRAAKERKAVVDDAAEALVAVLNPGASSRPHEQTPNGDDEEQADRPTDPEVQPEASVSGAGASFSREQHMERLDTLISKVRGNGATWCNHASPSQGMQAGTLPARMERLSAWEP